MHDANMDMTYWISLVHDRVQLTGCLEKDKELSALITGW